MFWMLALLSFSLIYTSCINNFESEDVKNENISQGNKELNGENVIFPGGAGEVCFSEKDLEMLLIDILRQYNDFFIAMDNSNARFAVSFDEDFDSQNSIIEKFDQIFPKYVKCLNFFMSFLRIDDYGNDLEFAESFEFEKSRFSQLQNSYNALREHYLDNFNSDYYFPSYDEVFSPYEKFMNIMDNHAVFDDFSVGIKVSYNESLAEVLMQLENSFDLRFKDFNAFLEDVYQCENVQLPVKSISFFQDAVISVLGDYAIIKDCIKDVNLDGTLSLFEKAALILDSVENGIVNWHGRVELLVENGTGKNNVLIFEPSVYFEKEEWGHLMEYVTDEKMSPLGKLDSIGSLPIFINISYAENGDTLFSKEYDLTELLNIYKAI